MGLLDALDSADPAALSALSRGLLSGRGFAQGAAMGVDGYQSAMLAARQRALAEEEVRQKMALQAAQVLEVQQQAELRRAQADNVGRKDAAAAAEEMRQRSLLAGARQAVTGIGANAASGVTGPRPEALGAVGNAPRIDYESLIQQFVDPARVKALADSRNYGRDEVTRTIESAGPNGVPMTTQFDKYGQPVGSPMAKAIEMKLMNLGGTEQAYNPFALAQGQSFQRTQTPDSKASNAVAWANNALAQKRLTMDAGNAGQLVETPEGYVRVNGAQSQAVAAPGGARPLMGKGQNLTEDQGKATNWLVQASNAFANMRQAQARTPGAELPGFLDAVAAVPSMGIGNAVAQSLRSPDRQRFMQGSSSLGEALLRAATGAGINQHEAEQKVKELTPVFGDKPDTIEQKMQSIALYMEGLKIRAGSGASKATAILGAPTGGGGGGGLSFDVDDPFGLRKGR